MVFQQNHLSRLDPGEVQYFIDHFEKMFSASQDRSQFRSSIVAGFSAPEEYLGIAENTVDRGSQLVTHVGQEAVFARLAVSARPRSSSAASLAFRSSISFSRSSRVRKSTVCTSCLCRKVICHVRQRIKR